MRILTWLAALRALACTCRSCSRFAISGHTSWAASESRARNGYTSQRRLLPLLEFLWRSIAYGFATRKRWSRHFVIAIFVLIILYASVFGALNLIHRAIMWRAIINASVFGGASAWYLLF